MLRNRTIVLIAILALLLGSLGLIGCSSSDDAAEETETTTEGTTDSGADEVLVGTWENPDGTYFSSITFASDGTGTAVDVDGDEAEITWTFTDDYLEVEIEFDGMTDMTGGGFTWEDEGAIFIWDADGTFTKVE